MTKLQSEAAEPVTRNEYRDGQVLSAEALRRDARYFLARERQHAALAHTPGVLVGLDLKVDEETGYTFVEKGAAIDGQGRLILVPARVTNPRIRGGRNRCRMSERGTRSSPRRFSKLASVVA